jgi:hypothetical protein
MDEMWNMQRLLEVHIIEELFLSLLSWRMSEKKKDLQ